MENIASTEFLAEYHELEQIRVFVERYMNMFGCSSEVVYDMSFSITELATNIIQHGYKEKSGNIEIIICREGRDFIVKIRDDAPIFDPATIPDPDLSKPLIEMPLSGLGLYITKNLVDSLTHQFTKTGGNEIILVKKNIIRNI